MLKPVKDRSVTIRFSSTDYEYLKALSYMAGTTVSQYMRMVANTAITAAKLSEQKGAFNLEDFKAVFDRNIQHDTLSH